MMTLGGKLFVSEVMTRVITVYPERDMNVCTKRDANSLSRYFNMQQYKWKPPVGGARGKVRGSSKSGAFSLWEPWLSVHGKE